MKYLNDYTKEAISQALEKTGSFFAFSDEQFDEQKKNDIEYVGLDAGLVAPKENAKKLLKMLDDAIEEGIKQDLRENKKKGVVLRELQNHEAFYTGSIEDTVKALKGYNIKREYIQAVYLSNYKKYKD